MAEKRIADLLVDSFDLTTRRKYEVKKENGEVITTVYFPPLTRQERKKAMSLNTSDLALDISTQLLCQIAEKENGEKAFSFADVAKLQRCLPEKVLNELEIFALDLEPVKVEDAKKD